MTPELVFGLASQVALLTWLLMLVFPRRPVVVTALAGRGTPLLLAVVYVALIAAAWNSSAGGFSSLSDVKTLFGNDWLLLAGWIHYLAFDLLVGRWELLDSPEVRDPVSARGPVSAADVPLRAGRMAALCDSADLLDATKSRGRVMIGIGCRHEGNRRDRRSPAYLRVHHRSRPAQGGAPQDEACWRRPL